MKELDPVLDEIVPDYKLARGIYSDAHKFEDAAGMSKDVFTNSKIRVILLPMLQNSDSMRKLL